MSIGKKQSPKNSIKYQSKLFAKDVHDSSFRADVKTIPNMYVFYDSDLPCIYSAYSHLCVYTTIDKDTFPVQKSIYADYQKTNNIECLFA